ncbi:TPA: hypothetical protein OMS40_003950 [Klebsiella aerogenes]|nr:hypothetical protein [Klebsiella aerogenes]
MTDITRLLASLKRRSAHAKEFGDSITFVKLKDIDELVEALEKAQSANAAQDDHINQQQDRIEQLEKRNAELGKYAKELESFRTAYMEWSDKTDWVQGDKRFDVLIPWGKHRADVLKAYIERLELRNAELEESHAQVIQSRDHYKRMSEEGLKQLAESRTVTVKLPKRSVGEVMHMSGFSRDYAEGWCAGNDNAIHQICNTPGIKWEAE